MKKAVWFAAGAAVGAVAGGYAAFALTSEIYGRVVQKLAGAWPLE